MAPKAPAASVAPAHVAAETKTMLQLPVLVSSPVDVGRLIREIESVDETLLQLGLRQSGTEVKMPKTTQLMDKIVEQNKLNLLQAEDRKKLHEFLESVKTSAPVLHVSFSADPNTAFIEKLMAWLRREIHPLLLMTVGLQPTIGAGAIVRSTNKYFDMSLKQDFAKKLNLLHESISKMAAAPADQVQPAPAPAPEAAA